MGGVAALRESEFTVLGGSRASAARPLHIVVFIVGGLPSLVWPLCLVSLLCLLCLVFRCVGDASRACVSCVVWRDTSAFTHHVWSLQRVVPLFGLPRVRASSKHLACVLRVCCVCAACVLCVCSVCALESASPGIHVFANTHSFQTHKSVQTHMNAASSSNHTHTHMPARTHTHTHMSAERASYCCNMSSCCHMPCGQEPRTQKHGV
jgi:hypothetical protein